MARGPTVCAVVLAGGSGARAGHAKQFRRAGGRSLLYHSCTAFAASPLVGGLVVVVPRGREIEVTAELDDAGMHKLLAVVPGGRTRSESSRAGLAALPPQCRIVLIHDAARPFVSVALIARVVRGVRRHGAVIPVLPVIDSIVELRDGGLVQRYLRRERLAVVQTPQGFLRRTLDEAFARRRRVDFTDDASVVRVVGGKVHTVPGEATNLKLTTSEEVDRAVRLLGGEDVTVRVGEGLDRHRLEAGRPLILGGVTVPSDRGLLGHSDGDALLHAVSSALLGALALGDLGQHFPDTDPAGKGRSSGDFVRHVLTLVRARGFEVGNVDATIMAEQPRLSPHIPAMRQNLASLLGVALDQVSVKATRGEGVGPEGEGRSILVRAVALVESRTSGKGGV